MNFYVNKFNLRLTPPGTQPELILEAGSIFTINSMHFDVIELKPAKKINGYEFIGVTTRLLEFGFKETENIEIC